MNTTSLYDDHRAAHDANQCMELCLRCRELEEDAMSRERQRILMGDGTITLFCALCEAMGEGTSITVDSEWEARERYRWGKNRLGQWACENCREKIVGAKSF